MAAQKHGLPHDPDTIRIAEYFEKHQGVPVSRDDIIKLAPQLDSMKRLRRNRGARDILDLKGIALLWGRGDKFVINQLGLGPVGQMEFVSYTPASTDELELLRSHRHQALRTPPHLQELV